LDAEYAADDLRALLSSHFTRRGFRVEKDKIIDSQMRWRPPIYARKDTHEIAVDIRLGSAITGFWLETYRALHRKRPKIEIYVAIPEDVGVSYQLGRNLETDNVGIILVSQDDVITLLKPRSAPEREATKAIRKKMDARIDNSTYADLSPYDKEISDAVNIFEIGCPREAIGAIGRVLETVINDYLEDANKRHRIHISKVRRDGMSFDNKINYLASQNEKGGRKKQEIITESEKSKMLSVKWDRNVGDHPASGEEISKMIRTSRAILELGINMIRLMKEKREDHKNPLK